MYCYNCNSIIEDGSIFCPECGKKVDGEGKDGSKIYQILPNHSIKFGEALLKYNSIRKRFESLSTKDTLRIKTAMSEELANTDNYEFLDKMCRRYIPEYGYAIMRQVQEAITVFREYDVTDIPESKLWEIALGKIDFYKTFYCAFMFLENYKARIADEIPINGFYILRKYSLYNQMRKLVKEKQYSNIFSSFNDTMAMLYGYKGYEISFDFSSREYGVKAANGLQNEGRKDLLESLKIINIANESLSEYVTNILHEKDLLELPELDPETSQKIYNSDGVNLFLPKDVRINSLCRCVELYPYNIDYLREIYICDNLSRKGLLEIAEETGVSQYVKIAFHNIDVRRNDLELDDYLKSGIVLDKKHKVAYNQGDLEYVLEGIPDVVYLFNGEYTVPLTYRNIRYIGLGKVKVIIDSNEKVNFNDFGIEFENVSFDEKYQNVEAEQASDKELYETARKLMAESNYESALVYYNNAADKNNAEALYELGLIYKNKKPFSADNLTKAKEYFEKAESLGSKVASVEIKILENQGYESFVYKERISQLISDHIEEFRDAYDYGGEFYFYPDISDKKLKNAIDAYGRRAKVNSNDVLYLYDSTILGSGTDGLLLTHEAFVSGNSSGSYSIVKLTDIEFLEWTDSGALIANLKETAIHCEENCAPIEREMESRKYLLSSFSSSRAELFTTLFNKIVLNGGYKEFISLADINFTKKIDEKLIPKIDELLKKRSEKKEMRSFSSEPVELVEARKNLIQTIRTLAQIKSSVLSETHLPENNEISNNQDSPINVEETFLVGKELYNQKKYGEAREKYETAARFGHIEAEIELGNMYYSGKFGAVNIKEAINWYLQAAAQGSDRAQYIMGNLYTQGKGVNKDAAKAFEWYCKAALQGHAVAQNNIGYAYLEGKGVNKDYTEALKWFNKSAEQGIASSYYHLGIMYSSGLGVEKNIDQAIYYYQKAVDNGIDAAKTPLSILTKVKKLFPSKEKTEMEDKPLQYSNNVPADSQKCYTEGCKYLNGEGVAQDSNKALEWFLQGAREGDALCQYYAGYIYSSDLLGNPNYEKCKYWFIKASENGVVEAKNYLETYKDFYATIKCGLENDNNITNIKAGNSTAENVNVTNNLHSALIPRTQTQALQVSEQDFVNLRNAFSEFTTEYNKGDYMVLDLVSDKKAKNVINSYAKGFGIPERDIKILIDATIFGNAKDGMILTDKLIMGSKMTGPIALNQIQYLVVESDDRNRQYIFAEPMHQCITSFIQNTHTRVFIEKVNQFIFKAKVKLVDDLTFINLKNSFGKPFWDKYSKNIMVMDSISSKLAEKALTLISHNDKVHPDIGINDIKLLIYESNFTRDNQAIIITNNYVIGSDSKEIIPIYQIESLKFESSLGTYDVYAEPMNTMLAMIDNSSANQRVLSKINQLIFNRP